MEAKEAEEWPQAVNLFNQVLKIDPYYEDIHEHLAHAGCQARLAALYAAAQAALKAERWQEAIDELSEIVGVDANYRDASTMLTQAGRTLAEVKTRERIAKLYAKGLEHYQKREWQRADDYFIQVFETDQNYRDVAQLFPETRRRARWSNSILGRMGQMLAGWMSHSQQNDQADESTEPLPSETIEQGE